MAHGEPTARGGTPRPARQERRVGKPPWRDPQARQGPGDPSPHQLAQGSWAPRRMDKHPSPVMPMGASLPWTHLTSARGAWGRQQPARSPSAPPVLGGKGGRAGDPGEPRGTESRRETRALNVYLWQREGISRGIPPHRIHPGGSANVPTGHPAPVPSRAPGGWWGPGIPQELDLPPPGDPFQASGGHGSPPRCCWLCQGPQLAEPHFPTTPPAVPFHPPHLHAAHCWSRTGRAPWA